MARDVILREVGLRDGLQSVATFVETADKLDWKAVRQTIQVRDGILAEVGLDRALAPSKPQPKKPVLQVAPPPRPATTPSPLLDPIDDEDTRNIPSEWLIEKSPDPWFDQP